MPLRSRRSSPQPATRLDAALAAGNLTARSITGRVVGAATPTTVVAGVVPVGIAVTGSNFPVLFLVIAAVYLLFCVGYLAASRLTPPDDASSAFYNLVRQGLGGIPGVGAGWVAVAAYTALTLGLYGLIGSVLSPPLSTLLGVDVPWEAIAVPAALLVGGLGLLRIEVGTRLLAVLVTGEVLMILVVTVANWTHPAAGTRPLTALDPHQLTTGAPVIAAQLALAVLGYIGTELTVVHTHHARDGHRGVARATMATIAVLTVLYVAAPAGLSVTLGVDGVVTAAQANPGELFVNTAQANLGAAFATVVQVLFATSVLAGTISFHGTTSLYCHYLGRDHAAPAVLARTSRTHGSPYVASLTQTALALIAITVVSSTGADPVQVLFYLGGTAGAVGILTLLALTALATAVILLRRRDTTDRARPDVPAETPNGNDGRLTQTAAGRRTTSRRRWTATAAIASTAVLGALITTVMIKLDTLLGVSAESPLPGLVRLSYLVVFAAGIGWAAWHQLFRPTATTPQTEDRR